MFFHYFWMAYEAWMVDENPRVGDLMLALLQAVEARPQSTECN